MQVLVSFNGGDTLEIEDAVTIALSDISDTILVTISRNDFVNLQGFAQGATALFTARINDFAGYTNIGAASIDQLQIDQMGPVIDSIAVESDNNYSTQGATIQGAKLGDDVSVVFRAMEDIRTPFVIIVGDTADTVSYTHLTLPTILLV